MKCADAQKEQIARRQSSLLSRNFKAHGLAGIAGSRRGWKLNYLRATSLLALSVLTSNHASAQSAYIVDSGFLGTTAILAAQLGIAGYAVSTGTTVPAMLNGYQQVYDLRYNTALTAPAIASYQDYLQNGGQLYLAGENPGAAPTRNPTLAAFAAGEGAGAFGTVMYASSLSQTTLPPLSTRPNALPTIELRGAGVYVAGGTGRVGNAACYTVDSAGNCSTVFFRGSGGRGNVLIVLDINVFDNAQSNSANVIQNLIALLNSQGENLIVLARTGNQYAVASGLQNAFNSSNQAGALVAALNNTPAKGIPAVLDALSGESATGAQQNTFNLMNQFLNVLFDPSIDAGAPAIGSGGGASAFADATDDARSRRLSSHPAEAYAAVTPRDRMAVKASSSFEQRWSVWSAAYGGSARTSGDPGVGSSTLNARIYGGVGGATYRISPDTKIGFAFGGAGTNYGLDGGLGGGRSDSFQSAVFGRHQFGAAYVSAAVAYAWQDVTTNRQVTVIGTDSLEARFKANTIAARGEAGWRFAAPAGGITPYAALQATTLYLPNYAEAATSGSNAFALNFASQSVTATRSELGARFDKEMLVHDGLFTLRGRLAWAHDYNTNRAVNATFQSLPGATFTVNGASPSADAALVTVGAEMKWRNGFALAGSFEGDFARNTETYAGKGIVRYIW